MLQLKSAAATPTLAYGLTYGVDLLPQPSGRRRPRGHVARVPLIIGTNSHEASMFAWTKPPMLPTTTASIDAYLDRVAPDAKDRVLAAYPDYPRRRALIAFGSDVMFGGPAWAFADAYSAHRADARVPVRPFRVEPAASRARRHSRQRDRAHPAQLRLVHRPQAAPARAAAAAARRQAHAARLAGLRGQGLGHGRNPLVQRAAWPIYDTEHRFTRIILSARDMVVEDPDAERRKAWAGLY